MNKKLKVAGGIILFLATFTYASTMDYAEQVVYNMPEKAVKAVVQKLGKDVSIYEIAREYNQNKDYYNNL